MSDNSPNDEDLFQNAIADTPAVAETTTETPQNVVETPQTVDEPATEGRVRDPLTGRFAAKAETTEPATDRPAIQGEAPAAQPDNAAQVPSWRLREVNDAREKAERLYQEEVAARQNLERQFSQMRQQWEASQRKPEEPADFYADPNAAFRQGVAPLEQQIQGLSTNLNLKVSRVLAVVEHGKEPVAEMEKAVEAAMRAGHPDMHNLAAQMRNSEDPVGVAMQWYQRDKLVKETGGDLATFKQRMLDEALKDPAFLAKALGQAKAQASGQLPGSTPNNLVQLPPSINRATSSASPHDEAGDLSDRSLYSFATQK